jgi:hypothetical protein
MNILLFFAGMQRSAPCHRSSLNIIRIIFQDPWSNRYRVIDLKEQYLKKKKKKKKKKKQKKKGKDKRKKRESDVRTPNREAGGWRSLSRASRSIKTIWRPHPRARARIISPERGKSDEACACAPRRLSRSRKKLTARTRGCASPRPCAIYRKIFMGPGRSRQSSERASRMSY